MTDLFNFTTKACQFGVFGNPIKHSKSPRIHQLFAQQFGMALQYEPIQVDVGGFAQAVSHFAAHGGAGLNVTVPFKVAAWQLCRRTENQLSARAQEAEAVNTLRFVVSDTDTSTSVWGDNTDGIGLIRDLENNVGLRLKGKRILVLGAGGAVRGIVGALVGSQPCQLVIANRTASKAQEIVTKLTACQTKSPNPTHLAALNMFGCGYERLDQYINEHLDDPPVGFDLIINGTSASLSDELPAVCQRCLHTASVAYDMMYADSPTVFMRWALANGAGRVGDGLGMLVEQAAESFYVWHEKRPDTVPVLRALREAKPSDGNAT